VRNVNCTPQLEFSTPCPYTFLRRTRSNCTAVPRQPNLLSLSFTRKFRNVSRIFFAIWWRSKKQETWNNYHNEPVVRKMGISGSWVALRKYESYKPYFSRYKISLKFCTKLPTVCKLIRKIYGAATAVLLSLVTNEMSCHWGGDALDPYFGELCSNICRNTGYSDCFRVC